MIYPEDKDQFIAAATRAWGLRHPNSKESKSKGEDVTEYESRRYYVVPSVTFSIDDAEEGTEKLFGRGQGTHRAYLLFRLMRKDTAQLVDALKEVRRLMLIGKSKKEIYKVIDDAIAGRD